MVATESRLAGGNEARDGTSVRGALAWSLLNSLLMRLGSLAMGIVLARLLDPQAFGVYAVALTVQTVLQTLADLGLSAELIRCKDPDRRAPTIASMSLLMGSILTAFTYASAGTLARLLGSPEAEPAIATLSLTLLLSSASVVPYAHLQRHLMQRKLFWIELATFVVGNSLALILIYNGFGVMSLAYGRVVGQSVGTLLQYVAAQKRPRFGFDRSVAPEALAFGIPLAGANLLSWALLNVDYVVISRMSGAIALGYYVLAFNISNWPVSALGQSIRTVALPVFARSPTKAVTVFVDVLRVTWVAGLLVATLLSSTATLLIRILYGEKWIPAAAVLMWLGAFGGLRLVFDLMASFLMSRGASRPVFVIQALWTVVLVPAVAGALLLGGLPLVGVAHLLVGFLIVLPSYLWALRNQGVRPIAVVVAMLPALPVAALAWLMASIATRVSTSPPLALLAGALVGGGTYALLVWPTIRASLRRIRAANSPTVPVVTRLGPD